MLLYNVYTTTVLLSTHRGCLLYCIPAGRKSTSIARRPVTTTLPQSSQPRVIYATPVGVARDSSTEVVHWTHDGNCIARPFQGPIQIFRQSAGMEWILSILNRNNFVQGCRPPDDGSVKLDVYDCSIECIEACFVPCIVSAEKTSIRTTTEAIQDEWYSDIETALIRR